MGIEPTQSAWKAEVLPLNYTRMNGAQGRSRTGTDFKVRRILSPVRLPISPPGQMMEVPAGLEPTMTELQSVALPTWLWNHFPVAQIVYNILYLIAILFLQKKYVSLPQYKKQSSDEVFSTELFLNYCAFTFVQQLLYISLTSWL